MCPASCQGGHQRRPRVLTERLHPAAPLLERDLPAHVLERLGRVATGEQDPRPQRVEATDRDSALGHVRAGQRALGTVDVARVEECGGERDPDRRRRPVAQKRSLDLERGAGRVGGGLEVTELVLPARPQERDHARADREPARRATAASSSSAARASSAASTAISASIAYWTAGRSIPLPRSSAPPASAWRASSRTVSAGAPVAAASNARKASTAGRGSARCRSASRSAARSGS